jgi:hypothetical protein
MSYKQQSLVINNDLIIDIHHNPMVNHQPYLLRVFGYDGSMEYRLNQQDMLNLAEQLADFVFDNPNSTGYTEDNTGLPRLWQYRRNEAIEELEKYRD